MSKFFFSERSPIASKKVYRDFKTMPFSALVESTGWDPLRWVNTAAAFSSLLFRYNYLKPYDIWHVPENGFYAARCSSE